MLFRTFKVDPALPVLVAGDPERLNMAAVDKDGGITYHQNQIENCNKLATRLGIKPMDLIGN